MPQSLSILLNPRSRHPPPKFARADSGAMLIGIFLGAVKPVNLKDNDYAIVIHGVTRSVDYGRMRALKTSDDYSKWVKSGKQFRSSHGILVLVTQGRLMAFIVHCCLQILRDTPEDTLTTNFAILPESQLQVDTDDTGLNPSPL